MRELQAKDLPFIDYTAMAVGLFDGFHVGHQALLKNMQAQDFAQVLFTFNSKPSVDKLLYTVQEKRSIADCLGVDYYYESTFDRELLQMEPEDFILMLTNDFALRHLTVGYDFRFGAAARGDTAMLAAEQSKYGYQLAVMPEVFANGSRVSSSIIRELIQSGNVLQAKKLLGRFYFVEGIVEKGSKLGRTMGIPTANISAEKLLPAHGVYATIIQLGKKFYFGVTNVGIKPTVKSDKRVNIETFLLDYQGDLYHNQIRVHFIHRIRSEKKFNNLDSLQKQIREDIQETDDYLSPMFDGHLKYRQNNTLKDLWI